MPVYYKGDVAGVTDSGGKFYCTDCLPEEFYPNDVVHWSEFEEGNIVFAPCDNCDRQITLSDKPD